jgi:hypothetical protein
MKTNHSPRGGQMIIGMLACLCSFGSALAQTNVPRGKLSVDHSINRVGALPQLDWQIEYPENVMGCVALIPPNIIRSKKNLQMRVRVLGASFLQAKTNNGHGNNKDTVDSSNPGRGDGGPNGETDSEGGFDDEGKSYSFVEVPVETFWSCNNSSWQRIFYGTQSVIDPASVVLDTRIQFNETVVFGSRGFLQTWRRLYTTSAETPNVIMLANGDTLPAIDAFESSQIVSFLKPYLEADGKTIKIGNRDLLVLFELGETNPRTRRFDLQDLGVLLTFEPTQEN